MPDDKDLKHSGAEIIEPTDLGSNKEDATPSETASRPVVDPATEHTVTITHGHGARWLTISILVVLILGVSAYLLIGQSSKEPLTDTTITSQQNAADLSKALTTEAFNIEQELNQLSDSDFDDSNLSDTSLYN